MMKSVYCSSLSKRACRAVIRENLDRFAFPTGMEQFTGWSVCGLFRVAYGRGFYSAEVGDGMVSRHFHPLFHRAVGRIREKGGRTVVSFRIYRGLTDAFSILPIVAVLFAFSLLIALFSLQSSPWEWELILAMAVLSLAISALLVLVSWLFSRFSHAGQENEQRLIAFLEQELSLHINSTKP